MRAPGRVRARTSGGAHPAGASPSGLVAGGREPQVVELFEPQVEQPIEAPQIEEPKVEAKIEGPQVEQPNVEAPKFEEPKFEAPKVEQPIGAPQIEEPKVEEAIEAPQIEEVEQPIEPFLAALVAWVADGGSAADVLGCLRANEREDLLWERRLFKVLAPARACLRDPPGWFPGSQAQYVTAMRMRAKGGTCNCIVLTALIEQWKGSAADASGGAAVEAICAQVEASEDNVKEHISQELERLLGPRVEIEDGDTRAIIAQKFQKRRTQLKLEEVAVRTQLVHREEEEKKRKRADSKGSRSSKSSKGSKGSKV